MGNHNPLLFGIAAAMDFSVGDDDFDNVIIDAKFFYDAPHRLRHLIIEQQIIIDIGFIRLFGYDRNLTDPMEMRRVACCRGSKNSEIY